MSVLISLLSGIAVSLFGIGLSASFCGALSSQRNRRFFWCRVALLLVIQGVVFAVWGADVLRYLYPIMMHLPLLLVLRYLTGKLLWPFISILFAYLCCELRRWIALLAVALLRGGDMMQDIGELIVTLPLLFLLLHFFAPVIRQFSVQPMKRQWIFGLIPAVYYVFDYGTRVYTDVLYSGGPAAVEFMPFMCCLVYMAFLLYLSNKEEVENQLQQVQKSLNLQLTQAVREINALRESQTMASQYRHDLRHHLQYLSACIENGQTEQAQSYISGICKEIEAQKVRQYCENEAANLILSAFVGRAQKDGVTLQIKGALPAMIPVSDSDLCVLLSNALENALHACQPLAAAGKDCTIEIWFYERRGKLFLQVTNPCENAVHFEKELPVSDQPGHGIGVQSICAIVQRYGGVYTFSVQNGQFVLRLSL